MTNLIPIAVFSGVFGVLSYTYGLTLSQTVALTLLMAANMLLSAEKARKDLIDEMERFNRKVPGK